MLVALNIFYWIIVAKVFIFLYPFAMSLTVNYDKSFYDVIKGSFKKTYYGRTSVLFGSAYLTLAVAFQYIYFKNLMIFNTTSLFIAGFLFLIMVAGIVDYKKNIIPDLITYPLILFGFIGAIVDPYFVSMPIDCAIGAMIGYLLPSILGFIYEMFGKKNSIGSGDIKFMAGIGAWLGLYGLIYSVIATCVLSVIWVIINKKRQLPLAPFFCGGILIYLFFFLGM